MLYIITLITSSINNIILGTNYAYYFLYLIMQNNDNMQQYFSCFSIGPATDFPGV